MCVCGWVFVCVCVCVRERERGGRERKKERVRVKSLCQCTSQNKSEHTNQVCLPVDMGKHSLLPDAKICIEEALLNRENQEKSGL